MDTNTMKKLLTVLILFAGRIVMAQNPHYSSFVSTEELRALTDTLEVDSVAQFHSDLLIDSSQDLKFSDTEFISTLGSDDLVFDSSDDIISHLSGVGDLFRVTNNSFSNLFTVDFSGAITLSTALTAANGGTGISSYAVGDILYASGTTTLSKSGANLTYDGTNFINSAGYLQQDNLRLNDNNFSAVTGDISILTSSNPRVTILSAGNVGVGTAIPATKFEVNGNTTTHNVVLSTPTAMALISTNTADAADTKSVEVNGGGGTGTTRGGNVTAYGNEHATNPGAVIFSTGGSGRVGATDATIQQTEAADGGTDAIVLRASRGTVAAPSNNVQSGGQDGPFIKFETYNGGYQESAYVSGAVDDNAASIASGKLGFWTKVNAGAVTEKMVITAAGDVGIGTTAPSSKLDVNGTLEVATRTGTGTSIVGATAGNVLTDITEGSDITLSGGAIRVTEGSFVENGGNTSGFARIVTKIIDIGDWNMDATGSVTIAHGLTATAIREVFVKINNDANNLFSPLDTDTGSGPYGYFDWDATNVRCFRIITGGYDNTSYDATSFNRGTIKIEYEEAAL